MGMNRHQTRAFRLSNQQFESVSKLFSYCTDLYSQEKALPLSAFVIFPIGETTPERVAEAAKKRKLTFRIQKTGGNVYLVKVGVEKRMIRFQLIANKGWWLFLGDGRSRVLREVLLESFIGNHLSWALEPSYINSDQLASILEGLALSFAKVDIVGCRYYQPGVTKLEFRRKGFQIAYHAGLMKELENDTNGTLSAIRVQFVDSGSVQNRVRLLTQSQMTLYGGFFTDFYQSIILPYVEESQKTRKKLSNKERRIDRHRIVLNPTTIQCRDEFSKVQIEGLQRTLVAHYSASISYSNPVMIAHIADRGDGSCFDVYLEGKSIQVVPATRATSGSFAQLISLLARFSPQILEIRHETYETLVVGG